MSAPTKQYGTTPPINTNPPTRLDTERNGELIEELKNQNCFEAKVESDKRVQVLEILQNLAENFVKDTCRAKGLPEHMIHNSGGKVFTFGSYRLGAYGPGSDIDTLLVAPTHISRADFFQLVPGMLLKLTPPAEEVSPVPDAFVPIIKFELQNISIDLIFARVPSVNSVPRDMSLENKELLKGCDEPNLRGLNGVRLTDELLGLVPHPGNFRMALRAIKLWAKTRAIYANVMGFPGGIAWAMLVAKICQLYPMAVSAVIVSKFFIIYTKWKWPQPVLLKDILEEGGQGAGLRIWNPKIYPADRNHLMPVITPNYPCMCSTHNITKSTKSVILREMERANGIVNDIMLGNAPWSKLFERHTFFTQDYKVYLRVLAAARTKEEQLKWSGLVESKLRHLVAKLEQLENIQLAHPFNKGFEYEAVCDTEDEALRVAHDGHHIVPGTTNGVTADGTSSDETGEKPEKIGVFTTSFYVGLVLDTSQAKKFDISWACQEFYDMCKTWNLYNEDLHSINVLYCRACDLPDNVFKPGEVKRQKKTKLVKRKMANGSTKKRSADEALVDDVKRSRTAPTAAVQNGSVGV
ncbi:Poly(A) polymerase central domain-containing protein [Tricharina praecox]|uniref:Poly(A) polymerase central domain-containing protein n=1 Tax=Tricharina praecox TaxID=43433 RepID=UPI00221F9C43|nr:Poly(A) polymerase central domain-containing protein [Tricharina praecox]KAI5850064.1 Poly(A) polymerase central domain-containing protein [Tricharina praecox]